LWILASSPGAAIAQQSETAARLDRAIAAIDRASAASTNPGMVIGITDRKQTLQIGATVTPT
jgi:hypothetical protein